MLIKLMIVGLVVLYGLGVRKFWIGYHRTNFQQTLPKRLSLSLLWPVLLLTNKSYRRNFNRALKGH